MDKTITDSVYMGFVTSARCKMCGKDTFAADEVCASCKRDQDDEELQTFFGQKIIDCD